MFQHSSAQVSSPKSQFDIWMFEMILSSPLVQKPLGHKRRGNMNNICIFSDFFIRDEDEKIFLEKKLLFKESAVRSQSIILSHPPVSHLQQLVLLTLPLSHVLVECNRDSLGLGSTPQAHAQLGQLVAHRAVKRGEVLGNGSFPPHFLSTHCGGAGRLLDL